MAQQQDAQTRALARARAHGLSIVGRGAWKHGAPFVVVGSASEPGRFHLVTIYPGRLACDCPARALCMHRALAHEDLESAQAKASTSQPLAALSVLQRDVAPLYRDNRPFSIFKQ